MAQTVFPNAMVTHVWAARSQRSGRSGNGNFYFNGPALYSYGSHFVVGYIMPGNVVLLNADRYSMSTNRHQSEAYSAARHLQRYSVPNLTRLVEIWPAPLNAAVRAKDSKDTSELKLAVGHFQVDRIEPTGDFKAGCHLIHWPEVERVAREIGVFEHAASADAVEPSSHAA